MIVPHQLSGHLIAFHTCLLFVGQKHIAWDKIHPLLGEESRPLMNRICVQCVLILLALFGLETIVEDGDQTPGRYNFPYGPLNTNAQSTFLSAAI